MVGPNGTAAGDRGGYQPQRDRRTLAWAGTDRRTPDADRRQPVPRPPPGRARGTHLQSPTDTTDSPADLQRTPGLAESVPVLAGGVRHFGPQSLTPAVGPWRSRH